jgi:lipopolysaccharide transport system permease protein
MSFKEDQSISIEITPRGIRRRYAGGMAGRLHSFWKNLHSVLHLVQLSLHQEVFGLSLGHLWHVLEPALQALAYFILITVVFRAAGHDTTFAFFFAGVTFWRSHSSLVCSGSSFLASRATQYIQSSLPLYVAYVELAVSEFVLFLVRFAMLCIFLVGAGIMPQITWPLGIAIVIIQFIFSMALNVWLSVFGAYFKDLGKFVGHIVWFWWYLSPGLYSLGRVPDWARPFYDLNPFAYLLPAINAVMLRGELPESGYALFNITVVSLLLLWAGGIVVRRTAYQLYRDL